MAGLFIAATVVSLLQYLRVRDRRLLLLAAMFACQSQALSREWYDVWRDVFQAGGVRGRPGAPAGAFAAPRPRGGASRRSRGAPPSDAKD